MLILKLTCIRQYMERMKMDNTYFKNISGTGKTKNLNRLFYRNKMGIDKDNVICLTGNKKENKEGRISVTIVSSRVAW